MSFSYSEDLDDPVSRLRFALGDTSADEVLAPDEIYEAVLLMQGVSLTAPLAVGPLADYALSSEGEVKAAVAVGRAIAARLSREPSSLSVTGLSVSFGGRLEGVRQTTETLQGRLTELTRARSGVLTSVIPSLGRYDD